MRSTLFGAVLAVGAVLTSDRAADAQVYNRAAPAYGAYANPYAGGYYTRHGYYVPGYGPPAAGYGNPYPAVPAFNGMSGLHSNAYFMPQPGTPYAGQAYNTYYGYTRPGFRKY